MKTLSELAGLVVRWENSFDDARTWKRVAVVLFALMLARVRRTVTASIGVRGRNHAPWSADYLAFSRANWKVDDIVEQVFLASVETADQLCGADRPVVMALDDTSVKKSSRVIAAAKYMRDPLSPPFHVNLRYGLRFVHSALILPLHVLGAAARAIPVAFDLSPAVKRPGARATDEEKAVYKVQKKQKKLTIAGLDRVIKLRKSLDKNGYAHRDLFIVADGSYTNRVMLKGMPARTEFVGRTRKDIRICQPAPAGSRKVYGKPLPTPEAIRQDEEYLWLEAKIHYANALRPVRFKEVNKILWQGGAQRRLLRLLIVAATPYRAPGKGKKKLQYNQPAYLLTTDLVTEASELLQHYFDRWQEEVEHRDMKSELGVGQAQVWSEASVAKFHTAYVAMWAMSKLAVLRVHGVERTEIYPERPDWYPQKRHHRASARDILEVYRDEAATKRMIAVQPTNELSQETACFPNKSMPLLPKSPP